MTQEHPTGASLSLGTPLPRRILIVRLGAIGDVANAIVVANALKDTDPDVSIGWAIHPLSLPLLEGHPSVDRVHLWPRMGGLAGFRTLMSSIRGARYDAAIDLQRLQKSTLIARLSGARRVIGFDRPRSKELSWIWTGERISAGPEREHMVLQYMRFPELLGAVSAPPRRSLPAIPQAQAFAKDFVARRGAPLLINLGASKPNKLWPLGSFRELLAQLLGTPSGPAFGPIVLTGGPGDKAAAESLEQGAPGVINLAGETSLPELWELAALSQAMVTADTGPMHLCAAVGTPVVAIFGPGDPARTGPYGPRHVVLHGDQRISFEGSAVDPAQPRIDAPMGKTRGETVLKVLTELLKPEAPLAEF